MTILGVDRGDQQVINIYSFQLYCQAGAKKGDPHWEPLERHVLKGYFIPAEARNRGLSPPRPSPAVRPGQ